MVPLTLETLASNDFGPCDCCGANSRTVSGTVLRGGEVVAAYFVQWTLGELERHGAHFDLILGKWGDRTSRRDRFVVTLECRRTETGPGLMVVDSANRPAASSELVARALSRSEVIGTPLAQLAFQVVDAIWLHDVRIAELTG